MREDGMSEVCSKHGPHSVLCRQCDYETVHEMELADAFEEYMRSAPAHFDWKMLARKAFNELHSARARVKALESAQGARVPEGLMQTLAKRIVDEVITCTACERGEANCHVVRFTYAEAEALASMIAGPRTMRPD